jgi:hypothetical protein
MMFNDASDDGIIDEIEPLTSFLSLRERRTRAR